MGIEKSFSCIPHYSNVVSLAFLITQFQNRALKMFALLWHEYKLYGSHVPEKTPGWYQVILIHTWLGLDLVKGRIM